MALENDHAVLVSGGTRGVCAAAARAAAREGAHAHRFDRIRITGPDIGWTDTDGEDAVLVPVGDQNVHGGLD